MASASRMSRNQKGLTLVGLILILAVIAVIAMFGIKVTPTVVEYFGIKKAIASVKSAGGSIPEMRAAFDRQAEVGYIDAINGKDLDIVKNGDDTDISFAYQKIIPLFGPASLLINYAGTTNDRMQKKAAP